MYHVDRYFLSGGGRVRFGTETRKHKSMDASRREEHKNEMQNRAGILLQRKAKQIETIETVRVKIRAVLIFRKKWFSFNFFS